MQKRTKGWETARDDPNHIGELLVTINGKEYAAQDIVSCEIERNLLENTAEVGNATAAVLTLEINQGEAIPKRAKVAVQYRLALDDAKTDYIPKGTYWINTREKDGCYLKLTCYDAMLMTQQDYLGDVTADDWPKQETDCAAEIAQRIGVEIDPRTKIGTGDNHQVSMPVGRTMREVLEQIAAANGGNWCITPAGKLLLVPFAGTGDVLPAVSGTPDCGAVQSITGVRVVRNDTDTPLLSGDETGTVLEVENENGTQALADELAQKLIGLPYAPYTCEQRYIDPVAEAGDKITVGGVACVAYNIKESLGPSHYADLEAPEEAGELEEEYPYLTETKRVKKQLDTVTTSVAEIRKDQESITAEVSKKATKDEVATEVESKVALELGKIQLGVSAGGWLDDLYASLSVDEQTVTAPTTAGTTRKGYSFTLPSGVLSQCNGSKGKLVVQYKVIEDVSRIADDTVTSESAINFWQNYSSGNVSRLLTWLAKRDGTTTPAGDWQTIEYEFDFKDEVPTSVYVYLYLSAGTGQVTIKKPQLFLKDTKSSNIVLTKDGVEISSSVLDMSGFTGNNEVRSKFAMDSENVTIESGVITFKGNTLVIESDNFKLKSDGSVSITGTFASTGSIGSAHISDGTFWMDAKNADGNTYNTIYMGRTNNTYPGGWMAVYNRRSDGKTGKGCEIVGGEADSWMWLNNAYGKGNTFLTSGESNTSFFEGNLDVKGATGLGVSKRVSCQNLTVGQTVTITGIDGEVNGATKTLKLMRVKFLNEYGYPVYQDFLALDGGRVYTGKHAHMDDGN